MMAKLWRWHLLPVALLLLQVSIIAAKATQQDSKNVATDSARSERQFSDVDLAPRLKGKGREYDDRASQAAVDTAWNILRSIPVPQKQYEVRTGFLANARYYAKEIFYLLFMNGPPTDSSRTAEADTRKLSPQLSEAVKLLEGAADEFNSDAIFLLAEMNFYGNYTHPRNYRKAFDRYHSLATLTGNSTAQYMLGFMYATGIGGAVERHQGQSLLYHTFAAMGGNTRSQMTLAFRRYVGIGASRNCDQAAYYYKQVADKAMDYYRSGPPGGQVLSRESYRWADDLGGLYGEGASMSSSGVNAHKDGHHSASDASLEDVLEYLDLMAKKGDAKATFSLGKMHYEGARHLDRNFKKAMKYFGLVVKRYWAKDGRVNQNHPVGIEKTAAKAAAHIGVMFLRGEGIEQNFEKAMTWFKRGREIGDPMCQHYLGLMYLHGYGVPEDAVKAASYFKAASEQDYPASETRLGALFLDQGDVATATKYFELAARYGWIEAFYYLAEIAERGIGRERHCGVATAYYKMVAERAEAVHSSFIEANAAYQEGDKETALVASMMAAEQGYENAQFNVAYLLDEQRSVLPLHSILPWPTRTGRPSILRNAALALIYWTRSAKQTNIDSLVKMGDYYFNGYGTTADLEKAKTCYQSAAEGHHSAQAFWNLGWMYENGLSVEQDFHLAKRYYDLALETNDEAYLPVKLSLIKLRMRSFWNRITHGKANSIQPEPEPKTSRSFKEWITDFIMYDEDEDGSYSYQPADRDDEDGMLESHLDENRHERGSEDGYYDDIDLEFETDILDNLILIGLVATLLLLVYFRQRNPQAQANQQRNGAAPAGGNGGNPAALPGNAAAAEEPRRQENRGLFPQPGDPDYPAWVAGGVGH